MSNGGVVVIFFFQYSSEPGRAFHRFHLPAFYFKATFLASERWPLKQHSPP